MAALGADVRDDKISHPITGPITDHSWDTTREMRIPIIAKTTSIGQDVDCARVDSPNPTLNPDFDEGEDERHRDQGDNEVNVIRQRQPVGDDVDDEHDCDDVDERLDDWDTRIDISHRPPRLQC